MRSRLLVPLLSLCIALFASSFAAAADLTPNPDPYALSASAPAVDLVVADIQPSVIPLGEAIKTTIADHEQTAIASVNRSPEPLYEPGPGIDLSGWRTTIAELPRYMEGQAAFRPGS